MFDASYKKFQSVLGVSLVLGVGAMSVLQPGGATGYVVAASDPVSFPWPVFLFGLFVGACIAGFAFGLLHHERNRL